jgi:hypothetical protein
MAAPSWNSSASAGDRPTDYAIGEKGRALLAGRRAG